MESEHSIFAVKLCEWEREYGRLHNWMHLFQGKNRNRSIRSGNGCRMSISRA